MVRHLPLNSLLSLLHSLLVLVLLLLLLLRVLLLLLLRCWRLLQARVYTRRSVPWQQMSTPTHSSISHEKHRNPYHRHNFPTARAKAPRAITHSP